MADSDKLKASTELRLLKTYNLLKYKEKGKATYYIAGSGLDITDSGLSTPAPDLSTPALDSVCQKKYNQK